MIFPDFHLSELEQDMKRKRLKLESAAEHFLSTTRAQLTPLSILKGNKKTILAAVLSLIAMGKLFGKVGKVVGPHLKGKMIFSVFNAAWIWKLINFTYKIYTLSDSKSKRSSRA